MVVRLVNSRRLSWSVTQINKQQWLGQVLHSFARMLLELTILKKQQVFSMLTKSNAFSALRFVRMRSTLSLIQYFMASLLCIGKHQHLLRNTLVETQDATKGAQASRTERIDWPQRETFSLFPKKHSREKVNTKEARANRVIEQTATFCKMHRKQFC